MMDALMKGASPTAMIANWSNDHQRSMIKYHKPESHVLMVLSISAVISTNGTGINTISL